MFPKLSEIMFKRTNNSKTNKTSPNPPEPRTIASRLQVKNQPIETSI